MLRRYTSVPLLGACALMLACPAAEARTVQLCKGKLQCEALMFDCGQDKNSIWASDGEGEDILGVCVFPR